MPKPAIQARGRKSARSTLPKKIRAAESVYEKHLLAQYGETPTEAMERESTLRELTSNYLQCHARLMALESRRTYEGDSEVTEAQVQTVVEELDGLEKALFDRFRLAVLCRLRVDIKELRELTTFLRVWKYEASEALPVDKARSDILALRIQCEADGRRMTHHELAAELDWPVKAYEVLRRLAKELDFPLASKRTGRPPKKSDK